MTAPYTHAYLPFLFFPSSHFPPPYPPLFHWLRCCRTQWFGVAPKPKADVVFFSRAAAELAKGSVVMRIEPGELAAAFPGKLNENERMKEVSASVQFAV